jgi:hypothetical protein
MNATQLLIVQFLLSLIAYTLIGWWFVGPWLAKKPKDQALMILVLPHAFRHLGANLLAPGMAAPTLPVEFARATAAGDLLTVGLALLSLVALRVGWRGARAVVWVFNVVGTCDLLLNVARGAHLQVAGHLGAAWYTPAFAVPGMLVAHVMIFAFLLRKPAPGGE